jgi:hypothetical protein
MKISRRDLLFASGLSLLVGTCAFGQEQPKPSQKQAARLLEALRGNRLPLTMSDGPSGPGWDSTSKTGFLWTHTSARSECLSWI